MAKNLRAKIPASDTLIVRDVNEDVMKRFAAEARETAQSNGAGANEAQVEIAQSAREVAEKSVSGYLPCRFSLCSASGFPARIVLHIFVLF